MKKVIAILLAAVLMLALVACGNGKTDPSSDPSQASSQAPSASPSASQSEAPADNPFTGEIGYYDVNYDYSKNPRYKMAYYTLTTGPLYEGVSDAFDMWCEKMNVEYSGLMTADGDKNAYLNNLPTLAAANDGLILDGDETQYDRIAEIVNETGVPWMTCFAIPRDYTKENMPLLNITVCFDMYDQGKEMTAELLRLKDELWPDVDASKFGVCVVAFSIAPPLQERSQGCVDAFAEAGWGDRTWVADCAIGNMDVDTVNTVVSSVLAQHSEYEYWLCFGLVDDCAPGASAAFSNIGLSENAAVVSIGGVGAQNQWDAGMYDSWRAAYLLPNSIYTEPMICALYAFMNGDATPETIWPEWVDQNDPGFAHMVLPSFWITPENYKSVFAWSDVYTESNLFPEYSKEGITRESYTPRMDVPESYKAS